MHARADADNGSPSLHGSLCHTERQPASFPAASTNHHANSPSTRKFVTCGSGYETLCMPSIARRISALCQSSGRHQPLLQIRILYFLCSNGFVECAFVSCGGRSGIAPPSSG